MSDFPILRIEVTVAAALVDTTDHIVGGNMADATVAFGWRTGPIPASGVSDAQVCRALSAQMGPVLALIQSALTMNGWVSLGEVDDPMGAYSTATGEVGETRPVTVKVVFPNEKGASSRSSRPSG